MSFNIAVGPNIRKSPYFDATVRDGVASFSVYNHMLIPGNFGDPDGEYERLIKGVAMWDVGAQRQVEIAGRDAGRLIQYLTGRNLSATKVGQGKYVPLCDYDGMLVNDPVLLKLSEDQFWLSLADSDMELWAKAVANERGYQVNICEPDVSPLAVQGPKAVEVIADLFGHWVRDLKYFWFKETDLQGIPVVLARSGWSKQGGFELYLRDQTRGTELWGLVKEAGEPYDIGPGAPNDTERLESGLVSYGADARHTRNPANPFELGLEKLIDLDGSHVFIGKQALQKIKAAGIKRHMVGLILEGDPIEGNQHPMAILKDGQQIGTLCEMTHSKRLNKNIAMALVGCENKAGDTLAVQMDGKDYRIEITTLPF